MQTKMKCPVNGKDGLAQRLAGKEIVAEIDRVEPGILLAVGCKPPLRGGVLAILFICAILRGNEFRLEWDNFVMARGHQSCPQHRVEILLLALAALPCRAIVTMDFVGVEIFGAVQGDEDMTSQPLELVEPFHAFQDRNRFGKDRMKQLRLRRIEHVPDLVVGRKLGYIEQGLAIRTCMLVLKPPLESRETTGSA